MTYTERPTVPHILIVDDMPANALLLERMLAERGYEARTALSGKLALQAARANAPDLILLDINMPEMNGYEVCEQLKADAALQDIPVIFISALHETIDKVRAFGVGGVDYVTKPFRFEEVYARVQTHLRLRRLEKLRDDLTHMVVHDLGSPLSTISFFLDYLEKREAGNLSANTREFISLARLGVEELRNMISSILDVSKITAGKIQLRPQPCDLDAIIRAVVATTQPLPNKRTLAYDAANVSITITVDVDLICRVLRNLLSNALKYTPEGGDVRIVVTPSDSQVRIAVTDSGPGIAPEYHQRIFEKFGQVEDRSNRFGTGLGLTFCKLAVEAHGGCIGVESQVGLGSTFWIALPLCNK